MSRIALIGANSIKYVEILIDIWNNNNSAVLIDWRTPVNEAINMMIEANVSCCFLDKTLTISNSDWLTKKTSINFVLFESLDEHVQVLPKYIYDKFDNNNYSNEEAVVIYSSGTTGQCKGVILSFFAINTNADLIGKYITPTNSDCILIIKSLSHSSTLVGELLLSLKNYIKIIITSKLLLPRNYYSLIEQYSVTFMCLNPTLLKMFVYEYSHNYNNYKKLTSLKTIYVSGDKLSDYTYTIAHDTLKNIAIYNMYGLTEAGPRVCAQQPNCCKSNSVGKPLDSVQINIVDEYGCVVSDGIKGLIYVYTPCVFKGYINGTKKTNSLKDGWINTGDIGYIDKNGELHITERMDDMIIIDSHNVYPSDIENKIINNSHITDCIIVKKDLNQTEVICCYYTSNKTIDINLKNKLKQLLLPHETPRVFIKCDKILYTMNGKKDRKNIEDYGDCKYE